MGYLRDRLIGTIHKEDCCCGGDCDCEHEYNHQEEHLSEEEIEQIINEKYSEKDEKTKAFIRRALGKFGDRFDYSKTQYIKAREKVIITCPVEGHGDFEQSPDVHLRKGSNGGCSICSGVKKLTTEEFIERAREVHGDRYKYDKVIYKNKNSLVIITCPIHGDFKQSPHNHLAGYGCYDCGKQLAADNHRHTTEEFIEMARKVHGDKYSYEKSDYKRFKDNIIITCPIHGDFEQTAGNHLQGKGCPICSGKIKITTEMFISRAIEVHGNGTYLYDRVNYINGTTPVEIYDPIYNEYFYQSPEVHLRGSGNPNRKMSSGERQIFNWLNLMNICFSREIYIKNTYGRHGNGIIVDFVIENYNNQKIIIEYNGGQHYRFTTKFHNTIDDFKAQVNRDNELRNYCKSNSIILIELPFILNNYYLISDFLTKTIIENIDPHVLIDYDSLYVFDDNST